MAKRATTRRIQTTQKKTPETTTKPEVRETRGSRNKPSMTTQKPQKLQKGRLRRRKVSETERMTPGTMTSLERPRMRPTGLGMFNREIFNDPFFTNPWEDMFNVPSVDDIIHKAKDMTRHAMRSADELSKGVDRSHPGSYTSKSFYRTISSGPNQEPRREVISQETTTNVDDQGRKFTEKWKNLEKDDVKKTTHIKMIGSKGVKEMKTHHMDSGEEFEHVDYHHMNEKDLPNFNSEFDRGIRSVNRLTSPMGRMLPEMGSWDKWGMHMPSINEMKRLPWGSSPRYSDMTDTSEEKGRKGSYSNL